MLVHAPLDALTLLTLENDRTIFNVDKTKTAYLRPSQPVRLVLPSAFVVEKGDGIRVFPSDFEEPCLFLERLEARLHELLTDGRAKSESQQSRVAQMLRMRDLEVSGRPFLQFRLDAPVDPPSAQRCSVELNLRNVAIFNKRSITVLWSARVDPEAAEEGVCSPPEEDEAGREGDADVPVAAHEEGPGAPDEDPQTEAPHTQGHEVPKTLDAAVHDSAPDAPDVGVAAPTNDVPLDMTVARSNVVASIARQMKSLKTTKSQISSLLSACARLHEMTEGASTTLELDKVVAIMGQMVAAHSKLVALGAAETRERRE